jgi:hypothetical protein
MNINRIITALQRINTALEKKQYCSAHQLRVLRKARAKWNKKLDALINPTAPPRPLPQRNNTPQLRLLALVLVLIMASCQRSKVVTPDNLGEVELVAVFTTQGHATTRVYKIKNSPCYVTVTGNHSSIFCTSNP